MILKMLSLEELEDYEQELSEREEAREFASSSEKIQLYKEMYQRVRKLMRENKEEYEHYAPYIKDKLVHLLIHYGTYLKMGNHKDDYLAYQCLEDALKYDCDNPVAAYRLGFLSYKKWDYLSAAKFFQKAIDNHQHNRQKAYKLTERQVMNAHIYLTNSALYIAKKTHEKMKELNYDGVEEIQEYEFSSLYNSLEDNEQYLLQNAFYKVTPEGTTTCSKEECNDLMGYQPRDTLILYFNDQNNSLGFNGEEKTLSKERADILHYLLVKSSEASPATRQDLQNSFRRTNESGEVSRENFRRAISRVRAKLTECSIPQVIQNTNYRGENAYYFNRSINFIIMYRVDEEMGYE
ncbi:DNA-binding winged helix-turn-helix (wHTH) protein [Bacillus tianshenii]|uniref:DNA-binding winged helix-turn-helix (WHTH) protein n=1 Tax=Sutcliffiella tianshenii TaxID=1463404 RepID=A0ABS2NZ99_9BACI|nr:hypothetical protein [Bacillus tianshenii]MBM7620035.1 DNA-binding winged helix-turn-helix (wHTH) protein [Bacillus tianshenii]